MSRIILKNISYILPGGKKIFNNLSFSFNPELIGVVGKNGIGKSTLAKIIAGKLTVQSGSVEVSGRLKSLPQILDDWIDSNVAEIFAIKNKYEALKRLENGQGNKEDLVILDDDWDLVEQVEIIKERIGISHIDLDRKYTSLSGGEKVRCLLASLLIDNPDFIILDEPTNHLDAEGRNIIYDFVKNWKKGMIVISHDKNLLRLMNTIAELSSIGFKSYGGNYDYYIQQKKLEDEAAQKEIRNVTVELKKLIEKKLHVIERQQKRNVSGEKRAEKSNQPKIMANQLKGSGEKTLKKLKEIHNEKINEIEKKLSDIKKKQRPNINIKLDISNKDHFKQKNIVTAERINFSYNKKKNIWLYDLSFNIYGGERIELRGKNGTGKTTLLKMIRGELKNLTGKLEVRSKKIGSLEQDISILDEEISILENINNASGRKLPEHDLRIKLGRFLFYKDDVFKKAKVLSGGERMRAGLACLLSSYKTPDLILLDEPTNNLDLESIEELIDGLNKYKGTILVVSHDPDFLREINVERIIDLDEYF